MTISKPSKILNELGHKIQGHHVSATEYIDHTFYINFTTETDDMSIRGICKL